MKWDDTIEDPSEELGCRLQPLELGLQAACQMYGLGCTIGAAADVAAMLSRARRRAWCGECLEVEIAQPYPASRFHRRRERRFVTWTLRATRVP